MEFKLTDKEKAQIEDIIEAGEEHTGFVNGADVLAIARILQRLFVDADKPETRRRGRPRKEDSEQKADPQEPVSKTAESASDDNKKEPTPQAAKA